MPATHRLVLLCLFVFSSLYATLPTSAQQVIATVNAGPLPYCLALNPVTNKVYVVNLAPINTVTEVDGATYTTAAIPVSSTPAVGYANCIAVNPVTNKIYELGGGDNTITVIDGVSHTTQILTAGNIPTAVAINQVTNKIYVANRGGNSVTILDGATNKSTTVQVGSFPTAIAVNPITNKIYVVNTNSNNVTVLDGNSSQTVTVPVGREPCCVALDSATNQIYVVNPFVPSTVSVIDGATNNTTSIGVGGAPDGIAVNEVTNQIYVSNQFDNTVTVIDGASHNTTTLTVALSPGAISVDPAANQIYVVDGGSNEVSVIDGASNNITLLKVGTVPVSVVSDSVTNRTYVTNVGGTVSVIAGANAPQPQRFVPITPCRAYDTRNTTPIQGGTSRNFTIPGTCDIPINATAYSFNVAVVPHGSLGYLTVWPTGQTQPVVATLNSLDGRVKSNAAIVPAGGIGDVSVFASMASNASTDVILDVNGYFEPATDTTALAFYPVAPCRLVDTRSGNGGMMQAGETRDFPLLSGPCHLPQSGIQAYSLNFAVVPPGPLGYLTAWPAGQSKPVVASLNDPTGTIAANAALVPAGTNGDIDVYVSGKTDVIIDIDGYFAPSSNGGLSLYGVAPCRVLDTRSTTGAFSGILAPVNVVASQCGIPESAGAFVFNATVVPEGALGYLTLWPDGENQPLVATLNAVDGAITNNMAIVPSTNGSIDAFAAGTTQLILDIFGYFAP